jgi:asparaginyl-tRNA synthetase
MESEWYSLVVAFGDCLTRSTVDFWAGRGLVNGHLPVTTGSISSPMGLGGDSKPVPVSMFGQQTYLADSMRFGLEYLCRLSPQGAYYLMQSFRGDESDATHLCQFIHSEAEIPGTLDAVMETVEAYLRHLVARYRAELGDRVLAVAGTLDHLARFDDPAPFRRVTFDEAAELLGDDRKFVVHDTTLGWRGLTRAGERRLIELCGEFVWVTHFEELSVPFYQAGHQRGSPLRSWRGRGGRSASPRRRVHPGRAGPAPGAGRGVRLARRHEGRDARWRPRGSAWAWSGSTCGWVSTTTSATTRSSSGRTAPPSFPDTEPSRLQ